ncbi:uncharacterized protein V2V93DRAFT_362054 [Kockiozyma suomiensis]|uniref:uncharacterized protein n=1 Tax=Kockiozyma suomiensis TaxID=1337062 RepID=UPI0033441F4B
MLYVDLYNIYSCIHLYHITVSYFILYINLCYIYLCFILFCAFIILLLLTSLLHVHDCCTRKKRDSHRNISPHGAGKGMYVS